MGYYTETLGTSWGEAMRTLYAEAPTIDYSVKGNSWVLDYGTSEADTNRLGFTTNPSSTEWVQQPIKSPTLVYVPERHSISGARPECATRLMAYNPKFKGLPAIESGSFPIASRSTRPSRAVTEDAIPLVADAFHQNRELLSSLLGGSLATHPDINVFVGYVDQTPAVTLTMIHDRPRRLIEIDHVATGEAFQGRGLAKRLLTSAMQESYYSGAVFYLTSDRQGPNLYEKLGFEQVETLVGWRIPQ